MKLSDSLLHAEKFGQLGIGIKRYFIFNRLGGPVKYIHNTDNLFFPPYSNLLTDKKSPNYELLSFYKNMRSGRKKGFIEYDLYEESEWRIICSETLLKKFPHEKRRYFINPKNHQNQDE